MVQKLFSALILLCLMLSSPAFAEVSSSNAGQAAKAQVEIDINQAKTRKSLMAFPPLQFVGNPATVKKYESTGSELYRVIFNDLSVSTYFQFINQSAFLEDTTKTGIRPAPGEPNGFKFESWKQIGAEFLIRGNYTVSGDEIAMEIYLYSVNRGALILGKKYKGETSLTRRIAHTFANDALKALTGVEGPFLSRVTVASDKAGGHYKEIYVMDWDGANSQKISSHHSITLSPAWSPDGTKVAYTAFVKSKKTKTRNADMFIYELNTGKRWLVSYRQGINSGADFSPDGKTLYLTISQTGTPDIYKMSTEGDLLTKITNGPRGAMNVEPAISPDGKKIAFSSDRSGNPMIYVMNADGTSPKRLTFAGKFNASPSWSPDGKKIAFAGWSDDHFDIFLMNADGTGMIRITSAHKPNGKWANNEDPVFSPDGRLLMYTSNRTGKNQIYISNLDGSEERRVTTDSDNYFKPKWSKNLE
jgi:TolB protein